MAELIVTLFPLAAMFGVMWFIMIRPQQKQAKLRKDMLDSLQVGHHVITIGGLHGLVDEINPANQTVVLDCEGIYLTFNRSAIATVKEVVEKPEIQEEPKAELAVETN